MSSKKKKAPWVVILGAGLGGLTVASQLDNYLEDHPDELQVVLVDRNHALVMGTANQFALVDRSRPEQVITSYADLLLRHVFFVQDEILTIDTDARMCFGRGHKFRYAKLVLALGADYDFDRIPGMAKAAYNLSSMNDVMQLKDAIADFRAGNILVSVCGLPFKGPCAPYVYALLLRSLIKRKNMDKVDRNTNIILTTPESAPWPKQNCSEMLRILKENDIDYRPNLTPHFVDVSQRAVIFKNGDKIKYEVLVGHFTHKAPEVLVESKLADASGFVPTNARTLKTKVPNVYCVGDCAEMTIPGTNEPHPKAGVFSMEQGKVVASDIIESLQKDDDSWNMNRGKAQNAPVEYIAEVGGNLAISIVSEYFDVDKDIDDAHTVSSPSKENMRHLISWWDATIATWFEQEQAPAQ